MELHGNARLTVLQRRELAYDVEAGMTVADAAEKYNVSHQDCSKVARAFRGL